MTDEGVSRATVAVPVDVLERAVWKMEIEYGHSVEYGHTPDDEHECWAEVEALRQYLVPAGALEEL